MELKSFAANTHQGPKLMINEDAYDYDLDNNLFMVIDGFGGVGIGDQLVIKLKENIKKTFLNFSKDKDSTFPFFYDQRYLPEGNALINSLLISHKEFYEANLSKEVSKRGGASIILAQQTESLLTLASVGNCLALLVRGGKILPVFTPDNFEFLNIDSSVKAYSTLPSSALGVYLNLYYQIKEVRVKENDYVILLTDGIYSRVDQDEILSIVLSTKMDIQKKNQELFKLSNFRGNFDNQTSFILEY